jgi:hypothetical protein
MYADNATNAIKDVYWEEYHEWQVEQAIWEEKCSICHCQLIIASQGTPTLITNEPTVQDSWNRLREFYIQASPTTRTQVVNEWFNNKLLPGANFDQWWNKNQDLVQLINELGDQMVPKIQPLTENDIEEHIYRNLPDSFNFLKQDYKKVSDFKMTYEQFIESIKRHGKDIDIENKNVGIKRKYEAHSAKADYIKNRNQKNSNYNGPKIFGNYDKGGASGGAPGSGPSTGGANNSSEQTKMKRSDFSNKERAKYEYEKYGAGKPERLPYDTKNIQDVVCINCHQKGHFMRNCPQPSNNNNIANNMMKNNYRKNNNKKFWRGGAKKGKVCIAQELEDGIKGSDLFYVGNEKVSYEKDDAINDHDEESSDSDPIAEVDEVDRVITRSEAIDQMLRNIYPDWFESEEEEIDFTNHSAGGVSTSEMDMIATGSILYYLI